MDRAWKAMDILGKKENLVHVFLVGAFAALSVRSVYQQREIEGLEAERDALEKSNKAMKKTMWDWKQQLLSESDEFSPVPLSRLQAIYGDAPGPAAKGVVGEAVSQGPASTSQKLVI